MAFLLSYNVGDGSSGTVLLRTCVCVCYIHIHIHYIYIYMLRYRRYSLSHGDASDDVDYDTIVCYAGKK